MVLGLRTFRLSLYLVLYFDQRYQNSLETTDQNSGASKNISPKFHEELKTNNRVLV
jgi:hypothetical protein